MSDDDKNFLPFAGVVVTVVGVIVAVAGIYATVYPHFTVELKRIAHAENKASVLEWDELTVNNRGLVPVTLTGVRVSLAYNFGVDREEIVPISGTAAVRLCKNKEDFQQSQNNPPPFNDTTIDDLNQPVSSGTMQQIYLIWRKDITEKASPRSTLGGFVDPWFDSQTELAWFVRLTSTFNDGSEVAFNVRPVSQDESPRGSETKEGRYPSIGSVSTQLWNSILHDGN